MLIETGSEQSIENAAVEDIAAVLDDEERYGGCLALTTDDGMIVQVSGDVGGPYVLQKVGQDGDLWTAPDEVNRETAQAFLEKVARNEPGWDAEYAWERESETAVGSGAGEGKGGCAGVIVLLLTVGSVGLGLLFA